MIHQRKILRFWIIILLCILNLGCKDKNKSEFLKDNVIANEDSFNKLVDYFISVVPDSNFIITIGVGTKNTVDLIYYKNEGGNAKYIGGNKLKNHSLELEKVLKNLGWTYETINTLKKGLNDINCDYIGNTEYHFKPINVYNTPNGFVNSSYLIYPLEILDSLKKELNGEPVGKSNFLKRVYIETSSAL